LFDFKQKGCDENVLTLRGADDLLAIVGETKNLTLLQHVAGKEIFEEAEKRIAVSEAQRDIVFTAIECLRNWIEDQIQIGGRNETEVLTDADYAGAFKECVSEDFIMAVIKSQLTLRRADDLLADVEETKDLSLLKYLGGDKLIEEAEKRIEEADKRIEESEAQKSSIFKAIGCLRYWIEDQIQIGGRNETEVLTDADYEGAFKECVSEDFLKAKTSN